MESIKKSEYKFRIAFNILYLIISLPGLSILFFFPPRYLLFNKKSKNFQNIFYLYKTFVKSIYENINKTFIKNVTITNHTSCPENFEVLFIQNEHFGYFSKFYGNDTFFCVEKFNEKNYNYEYLLSLTNSSEKINECKEGTRKCGNLNKLYSFPLCVDNNIQCPINVMIFGTIPDAKANKYSFSTYFFSTSNNFNEPVMIDIEIRNNVKLCLEKFPIEDHSCEIFDNNQCLIVNGGKKIETQKYEDEVSLTPANLAKWNLDKDDNIVHEFCNVNSFFQVFETGYINFTYQNLLDFKTEFPLKNENNNSLYETCNAFKSSEEYDILFYLISFILLCWSVAHFVIQLLFFFDKFNVRKYYLWNGIILFLFKLFSYFGMIIYHFFFYLRVKKVYLVLVDIPRNQVLNLYRSTRNAFITKVVIFGLIGFVIISVDLIILFFIIITKFRIDSIKEEKEKEKEKEKENNKLNVTNIKEDENQNEKAKNSRNLSNNITSSETRQDQLRSSQIRLVNQQETVNNATSNTTSNNNNSNNFNNANNTNNTNNTKRKILENPYNEISLIFILNNDASKVYKVNAQKGDRFSDVIKKLKSENSELSEMNMKLFYFGSRVINKNLTVLENSLSSEKKIAILCD